jgi:hypothetical protein
LHRHTYSASTTRNEERERGREGEREEESGASGSTIDKINVNILETNFNGLSNGTDRQNALLT